MITIIKLWRTFQFAEDAGCIVPAGSLGGGRQSLSRRMVRPVLGPLLHAVSRHGRRPAAASSGRFHHPRPDLHVPRHVYGTDGDHMADGRHSVQPVHGGLLAVQGTAASQDRYRSSRGRRRRSAVRCLQPSQVLRLTVYLLLSLSRLQNSKVLNKLCKAGDRVMCSFTF